MNAYQSTAVAILALVLAACASAPPPPLTPAAPPYDPVSLMAAINQAATADGRELVVKPLSDPANEGVQQDVAGLHAQSRLEEAAAALDTALEARPEDPVLLQARAENALLQGDLGGAEQFARRAAAAGAQAGPQCRRHWETVVQVLAVQMTEDAALAAARSSRDACTVAAPPRF